MCTTKIIILSLVRLIFFRNTSFFNKKNFYKKMSLKNPKTLRKYLENLQPQVPEPQFLKMLIFLRAL